MPGIYIHIPFCNSKCYYCDFYSKATKDIFIINKYVDALCNEIIFRKNYLQTQKIETIYFGGGTPSTLSIEQINKIFDCIFKNFKINKKENEITFEANPENLTQDYLSDLQRHTPINRLSIGVQSFFDDDLKFMNRKHSAKQAIQAIVDAQKAGFSNISADIIYGLPSMSISRLKKNLQQFFALNIPHLSAYHLTIEPNTVFGKWLQKGKIKEIDEIQSSKLFATLIELMDKNNFLHYEISNFAKNNFIAKHNFAYWTGEKYLGLGAAAHSYDGKSRQWNIANTKLYIDKIFNKQNDFFDIEKLSEIDKFNEYIITHLRTYTGLNISELETKHKKFYLQIKNTIDDFFASEHLMKKNDNIILTNKGKLISDAIIADLMIVA
jgi:oxygen-independent coproporphyrinogen-3 oxidase